MTPRYHHAAWAALGFLLIVLGAAPARAHGPSSPNDLAGRLLVAAPAMADGFFARTVIYMLEHDATGALGVIINNPMGEVSFANLMDGLGIDGGGNRGGRVTIYNGGPVEAGRVFVLLPGGDDSGADVLGLADGLVLSRDADMLRALAAGEGPLRSLLLFGYAGWGPGQLESEIMRDDWVIVPADEALVFDRDDSTKWRRAMDSLGIAL